MGENNRPWIIAVITSAFLIACLIMILIDVIVIRRQRKEIPHDDETYVNNDDDTDDDDDSMIVPSTVNLSEGSGNEKDVRTTGTSTSSTGLSCDSSCNDV
jgi:hypothetical protein